MISGHFMNILSENHHGQGSNMVAQRA